MAGTLITIQVGGLKYVLDTATDTVKVLVGVTPTSTTPQSMTDSSTNADYQVTTGKTFNALGIYWTEMGTAGSVTFYQGDTADAITTSKYTLNVGSTNTGGHEIPVSFTVAADKFVTSDPSAANVTAQFTLIGYEA